jgi:hypothetical protein
MLGIGFIKEDLFLAALGMTENEIHAWLRRR